MDELFRLRLSVSFFQSTVERIEIIGSNIFQSKLISSSSHPHSGLVANDQSVVLCHVFFFPSDCK